MFFLPGRVHVVVHACICACVPACVAVCLSRFHPLAAVDLLVQEAHAITLSKVLHAAACNKTFRTLDTGVHPLQLKERVAVQGTDIAK